MKHRKAIFRSYGVAKLYNAVVIGEFTLIIKPAYGMKKSAQNFMVSIMKFCLCRAFTNRISEHYIHADTGDMTIHRGKLRRKELAGPELLVELWTQ